MAAAIGYLDGSRLRRSLLAGAEWLAAGREELNRINVYPVPDGDTGTNLSLTIRAVADALRRVGDAPLPEVSRAAAHASVLGARGNSGMMLSHFLIGFSEAVGGRARLRAGELAAAMRRGVERLHAALDNPVEGTILTVCREAAIAAEGAAASISDLKLLLRHTLEAAEQSLERTPELLAALRDAGVVDAGGKGFVRLLRGMMRLVEGEPTAAPSLEASAVGPTAAAPAALAGVAEADDYRFCTEALVRGPDLPTSAAAREVLRTLGGSVVVLRSDDLLRLHIHTDDATQVLALAGTWGAVEMRKVDDVREQHRLLTSARRTVAIIADTSCDLPDELLDRHGIGLVPLQLLFGDRVYQDRLEMDPREFYRRLRAGPILPTTSQPTPAAFTAAYEHARAGADEVVCVLLSGALSGTLASAEAARRSFAAGRVVLVDSRSASLGLGLLALRGAELAAAGWSAGEIARELERVRTQSGMFFTVDTLDFLLRSGRVTRTKAWLAGLLDLKPILSLDAQGHIVPVARVRGRAALIPKVLGLLDRALARRPDRLRLGIAHADAPAVADELRDRLLSRYRPLDVLVRPATGVLGAHAGPDAWGVFYQIEDGAPSGAAEVGNK